MFVCVKNWKEGTEADKSLGGEKAVADKNAEGRYNKKKSWGGEVFFMGL